MAGAYSVGVLGRHRWLRPGAASVLALAAMVAFGLMPVSATTTNPFPSSSTGIDVSYPNCGKPLPSSSSTFAIVGVTDGRPFTTYKCLSGLWKSAPLTVIGPESYQPSAYFNTGYSGAYGRDINVQACGNPGGSGFNPGLTAHAQKQADQAWEIGCSEASYAYATLAKAATTQPFMLFADIETGNSWSSNVTLNQYAIDGISWGMAHTGSTTSNSWGIYSSRSMWTTITGSAKWSPTTTTKSTTPAVTANWVTGLEGGCPNSSTGSVFDTAVSTWLSQVTTGSIDTDKLCNVS